jgi:hypothetical protein
MIGAGRSVRDRVHAHVVLSPMPQRWRAVWP